MDPSKRQANRHPLPACSNTNSIRESVRALRTPIRFLKGIGPKRAEQLARAGLETVEDLLYHLPFRYEDRREIRKIRDASPGHAESFIGQLARIEKKYIPRRRAQMLVGQLADDGGVIDLVWYRAPSYLAAELERGQRLLVHGRVERSAGSRQRLVHPSFEVLDSGVGLDLQKILPVYLRPGALPLSLIRKWIAAAICDYAEYLSIQLPKELIERQMLMSLDKALAALHQPSRDADVAALNAASSTAHRSIIFAELFYLQLGLGLRKRRRIEGRAISIRRKGRRLFAEMRALLPFKLTRAQERVIAEIDTDLASSLPMQRLVQGDVGSGKTIVAWFASLRVIDHGYQAVWMAPTELLAEQHFQNIKPFAAALGIRAALLTGSLAAKERDTALGAIRRGETEFVVGTHALIQEDVEIPRLGLGVIDEQHRFGVLQRLSLQRLIGRQASSVPQGRQPHTLLMSATPIPRSLAMVLYGDMEVSFLDEMPPGRVPVETKVFRSNERRELYNLVVRELKAGHQAFIVYPLVEASEELQDVRNATQMAEKMRQSVFKDFGVGLIHGRMTVAERDDVMRAFRDGAVGVLVSTTVIEVGIDVPNATVMVVEHAERFGLSQLHQLRGRVGRGQAAGYCLLVNRGARNPLAEKRLGVMEREHDGFKIAEADLALRGPGEFLGTRQSGLGDFRLANLARDAHLLIAARHEAKAWLEKDPDLRSAESAAMLQTLLHRWGQRLQLGAVG